MLLQVSKDINTSSFVIHHPLNRKSKKEKRQSWKKSHLPFSWTIFQGLKEGGLELYLGTSWDKYDLAFVF